MTEERKNELMEEFLQISTEISKKSPLQGVVFTLKIIPEFFEKIWREGYYAGIEEGKRLKEKEISQKN